MKNIRMIIGVSAVALTALVLAVVGQTPDATSASPQTALSTMALGKMFTYFIVMLGPIKIVGPFVKLTRGMDAPASRILAVKGFLIACVIGLAAATVGQSTLANWGVSVPALLIAAGLVLFLVALKGVLSSYEPKPAATADAPEAPTAPSTLLALSPLAFPNIITPYGVAALILLLASAAPGQSYAIFGVFIAVMVINLIVMFFAGPILKYGGAVLAILGSVLGVLQVALAIQMIMVALRMLGVLAQSAG